MTNNVSGISVRRVACASFPSRYGNFRIYGYEQNPGAEPYVVLVAGEPGPDSVPLVRIHSQCLTGDVLGSLRCDCGEQLHRALAQIQKSGCGLLIYQMQEGRGIGILAKLEAYALQDNGADTVEANEMLGFDPDLRQYEGCVEILRDFGIRRIRLLSNNPEKIDSVMAGGIEIVERVPLEIAPQPASESYLRTKKAKLGHYLDEV